MRKIYIFALAAALLALAGCEKGTVPEGAGGITVQASIGTMTKVSYNGASTSFTDGDRISVYAWTGSAASVPAKRVVNGEVNTFDGTAWTPANRMEWGGLTKAHYFLGITPVAAVTDFTADPYTLDPSKYTESDLLIATSLDGIKPSATPVDLTFTHAMAKLNVNLKFHNEFGGTPTVTGVTVKAKNTATVNYLTKVVTATGDASYVDIPAAATPATGYALSFSGLQVPQTGVTTVAVTIAGKTYLYESDTEIPLMGGRYTTMGLIVGKDKLDLDSVEVSDWTTGTDLPGGEAEMFDALHTPLTLEATENGTTVTITDESGVTFSYTVNGGAPVSTSADTTIPLQAGDKVQFFSTNSALGVNTDPENPEGYSFLRIKVDKKSYVYGNVMSMVDDTGDFANDVTLADYAMPGLFTGYSSANYISFLDSKPLILPATNISKYCYNGMFARCAELSSLPEGFLPAKEMKEQCYAFMFVACSSLTSLPDDLLPAGRGGEGSLAEYCYYCMFQSCADLTTLADDFLPATTLADNCYHGMFKGCDKLTHAPTLKASTLVKECYWDIFCECRGLSEVTCLATNISASNCLYSWLSNAGKNISGPKTLYVDPGMTGVDTGTSTGKWNLYDGWTLQSYDAP